MCRPGSSFNCPFRADVFAFSPDRISIYFIERIATRPIYLRDFTPFLALKHITGAQFLYLHMYACVYVCVYVMFFLSIHIKKRYRQFHLSLRSFSRITIFYLHLPLRVRVAIFTIACLASSTPIFRLVKNICCISAPLCLSLNLFRTLSISLTLSYDVSRRDLRRRPRTV